MVLFAVEASAVGSGRPCGVYMFSGLTVLLFNIYNITVTKPTICATQTNNTSNINLYFSVH